MNDEIKQWLQQAKAAGLSDEQISQQLLARDWTNETISELLHPGQKLSNNISAREPKKKINKSVIIGIIVMVIILLVGVIYYFLIYGSKNSNTNQISAIQNVNQQSTTNTVTNDIVIEDALSFCGSVGNAKIFGIWQECVFGVAYYNHDASICNTDFSNIKSVAALDSLAVQRCKRTISEGRFMYHEYITASSCDDPRYTNSNTDQRCNDKCIKEDLNYISYDYYKNNPELSDPFSIPGFTTCSKDNALLISSCYCF